MPNFFTFDLPIATGLKRFFAIVLLFIFFLQFAGVYIYFSFRLISIKAEMQQEIESLQLVLTRRQYKAARVGEHEVQVEGKMYDVSRIELKDNKVVIYAWQDASEDNLMALFHSVFKRTHKDRKRVPSTAVKLLTLQYLASSVITGFSETQTRVAYTAYLLRYNSLTQPLDTPPPRA